MRKGGIEPTVPLREQRFSDRPIGHSLHLSTRPIGFLNTYYRGSPPHPELPSTIRRPTLSLSRSYAETGVLSDLQKGARIGMGLILTSGPSWIYLPSDKDFGIINGLCPKLFYGIGTKCRRSVIRTLSASKPVLPAGDSLHSGSRARSP